MKQNKKAFTLIELLVVVLIIGILAAVALPQYRKAVMKSRLVDWTITANAYMKAIDLWLLSNGYPSTTVYFTGNSDELNVQHALDIQISCDAEKNIDCYNSTGKWRVYCTASRCVIDFSDDDSTWLKDVIYVAKDSKFNGQWYLFVAPQAVDWKTKLVCQMWKENYGTELIDDSGYKPKQVCASLGIE